MSKNAVKSVMLLASFAFLIASCSTVDYRPPSQQGKKSTIRTSKNGNSKEQRLREDIARHAKKYVGVKYKYAGKSPKGFDCSGFTGYVFEKFDITLSASSQAQATSGKKIPLSKAKAGDLLFFGKHGKINHVALIVSNSPDGIEVIHSTSSKGVMIQNVSQSSYWKPRILFARDVMP
jgi:cell wall-associated NlpC family hydrolase